MARLALADKCVVLCQGALPVLAWPNFVSMHAFDAQVAPPLECRVHVSGSTAFSAVISNLRHTPERLIWAARRCIGNRGQASTAHVTSLYDGKLRANAESSLQAQTHANQQIVLQTHANQVIVLQTMPAGDTY